MCCRSLRCYIGLCHPAIDDEVSAVDEAAFIAGQEEHSLRLLDGFTKATSRKMHFTPVPLLLVITEPVLEKWRIQWSRAESVEAVAFASMHDRKLAGHGQDCAL